ncbi:MAG: tandem-95 repeat protein, partial [Gemmatimonadetes bacterium]|nr:tandem-95 repeat protein [Gemmatimonadota bacterium]
SEYAFELPENLDGSGLQPVDLGPVSATDPDGDRLDYVLAEGDAQRFAVDSRDGTLMYTGPGEDFETPPNVYELIVEATDPDGEMAEADVVVRVVNVVELPAAVDDTATTDEDVALTVDVLANDSDPEGTGLRVSSVSAAENGTTEVAADGGAVRYTPDENWYGTDRFTYAAEDGNGAATEAAVEVTVLPVNDAPEAAADTASTDEDEAVEVPVLANDTDVDGDTLRVSSVTKPANGTAAVAADGSGVRYMPDENWHGTDTFTYVADDGNGGTSEAAVEVTVVPVNDVPVANDDAATTNEDEPVTVPVLANDTDADGDGLKVSAVTAPSNGTAAIAAGGVRYTPDANWHGTDTFTYTVDDGNGATASAAVEVTVLPVNDAPEAVGTIPNQSLDEGGESANIELGPFFSDTDGDALLYRTVSSDPAVVEATITGSVLTLSPVGYGVAAVAVAASDPGGLQAMQTVAVRVSDRPAREVMSHAFAGMARGHLASARMTLGRRTSASRSGASRLSLMGRKVPLGTKAARAEAERMWSGWLSGVTSRVRSEAAPDAGAPMSAGASMAGGTSMAPGAPMSAGASRSPAGSPGGPGGQGGPSAAGRDGSDDDMTLGDLFRVGDLAPRFEGGRDPLRGSEFQFTFGVGQEAGGGGGVRLQLWGQGDVQTFQGAPTEASDYKGELQTGYVGLDTRLGNTWLLGVAVARSRGTGDWTAGGASGSLETRLVAVHPYLQWSSGGTSLWLTAGGGWGDADNVRETGHREASGLGLRLGLVELRRRLAAGGGFELGLRADAGWAELATDVGTQTLDSQVAAVNQVRLGTELSQQIRLGGLTLAPFGEAHVRRDGGAGQPGTGLELTGGLRARAGFLRIDAQGRMLAVHSVAGYEERGLGLTLSLGNPGGEGLSLSMSPRWGDAATGSDALWQDQIYTRYAPPAPASASASADGEPAPNPRDAWTFDVRGDYAHRIPGGRLLNWSA